MKIFVKAKPNSKFEKVEKISETEFKVAVCEPSEKGKANEALTRVLSEYFKVAKSRIKIKAGRGSKNKIVEII
jgi:uncharacterized protein YggU (UPF0235/DUF167 family)